MTIDKKVKIKEEIDELGTFISEGIDLMTEKLINIKQSPIDKYTYLSMQELNSSVDKALYNRYKLILLYKL